MAAGEAGSSSVARDWNAALLQSDNASLLQTYEWGCLKQAFGWRPVRIAGNGGSVQLLLRQTPAGRIAYVPRGPAVAGGADGLSRLLPDMHDACRQAGAFALKIEPPWPYSESGARELAALGLRPSTQTVQPQSTVCVDIDGDEEATLARMRPKTRYNIRLATKKGVTVRLGDAGDLERFAALMAETGRRDGFGIHPAAYYERAFQLFAPAGMVALLLAEHDGVTLAGLMVFAFGATAYYLYGASSNQKRNLMPAYAVQWEAMRWARAQGCRRYDLWGIPDEVGRNPSAYMEDDPPQREGLWGVWRFKRGFGGEIVRYIGAWDFVYRPAAYRLYSILLRLRSHGLGG